MMHRLQVLLTRVRHILRKEGSGRLLRMVLLTLVSYFFRYERYYLYKNTLADMDEDKIKPGVPDFSFRAVSTNREADALVGEGFEFAHSDGVHREWLDKGATAFCVFAGRELAFIAWAAMNEKAQRTVSYIPMPVNFDGGDAYAAGMYTYPKYRRAGVGTYGYYKRSQYLRERGVKSLWGAVYIGNRTVHKAAEGKGSYIYGRGRLLKILWWKSWKEKPLKQAR